MVNDRKIFEAGQANIMCVSRYRARVIAITPKVRVKFVDYGNECDVPNGGLLQLESACLRDMPAQGVCIRLADGAPCKMADENVFRVKPLQVVVSFICTHIHQCTVYILAYIYLYYPFIHLCYFLGE